MPTTSPMINTTRADFFEAIGRGSSRAENDQDAENISETRIRVPIVRSLAADLITPVSAYLTLRGESTHSFLFESVEGGERLARYSFVGVRPSLLIRSVGQRSEIEHKTGPDSGRIDTVDGDPRDLLRTLINRAKLVEAPGLPRFLGGAVGFFAYDSVRLVEAIPRTLEDPLATPDLCLALHDEVLAFDHRSGVVHLVRIVELSPADDKANLDALFDEANVALAELEERLQVPGTASLRIAPGAHSKQAEHPAPQFRSSIDKESFEAAVQRCQEHIRAGDIFQVVLSRRLSCPLSADPFSVYRALRILNPSPYLFFLELGEHTLAGASPEMLVRVEGQTVQTMPIAGTRRRGDTVEHDEALAVELQEDPKELAEHEMLVDLGRNDIGRISTFGSVRVAQHREVQRFSHVMHLVSRVVGELSPDHDALDALYACFPAGTVSGAPKVRAMEIIETEEPTSRGVYAGAVGYLDYRGDLDTCIAIRTVVACQGEAHVQAGAGIVIDSVPEREFEETANKAGALVDAIGWAESGALDLGPPKEATKGPHEEPSC